MGSVRPSFEGKRWRRLNEALGICSEHGRFGWRGLPLRNTQRTISIYILVCSQGFRSLSCLDHPVTRLHTNLLRQKNWMSGLCALAYNDTPQEKWNKSRRNTKLEIVSRGNNQKCILGLSITNHSKEKDVKEREANQHLFLACSLLKALNWFLKYLYKR